MRKGEQRGLNLTFRRFSAHHAPCSSISEHTVHDLRARLCGPAELRSRETREARAEASSAGVRAQEEGDEEDRNEEEGDEEEGG